MEYIILQDGHIIINGIDHGDFIWVLDKSDTNANIKFGNVETIHNIIILNNDIEQSIRQYVYEQNGVITHDF